MKRDYDLLRHLLEYIEAQDSPGIYGSTTMLSATPARRWTTISVF